MLALLFPGQGSLYPGMHKKWLICKEFTQVLAEAGDILKLNLQDILEKSRAEELSRTSLAQPLILTLSYGLYQLIKMQGLVPRVALGHSLGSYSALVAAKVLTFQEGLQIVSKRGELVETYLGENFPGGLLAIIGHSEEAVRTMLDKHPLLDITNINAVDQIVVGGRDEDIGALHSELKKDGVRAVKLSVSHPFHTRYLQVVASDFSSFLEDFNFQIPRITYISPGLAQVLTAGEEIKNTLTRELFTPVIFYKCLLKTKEMGITTYLECGPGEVLSKLAKKTLLQAEVYSLDGEGLEVLRRIKDVS